MPTITPVDLQTLGARVTDPAQLTKGRWYAVRTNYTGTYNPLVHAKYIGNMGGLNEFVVAEEDHKALHRSLGLSKRIRRENSSIRTGKISGGGVCEVFKFKQVKDEPVSIPQKSPYEDLPFATCAHYGIKVGDKFKVINAAFCNDLIQVGDIVTLTEDDGTPAPVFVNESTGKSICLFLYRLVPVLANQSNTVEPTTTLSTVDQFKSEIDALLAKAQQKRDQIAELSEEITGIALAVEDTRAKLRASLVGYI